MINYISFTCSALQIEVHSGVITGSRKMLLSASSGNNFLRWLAGKWQVYFLVNIYARLLFYDEYLEICICPILFWY